MYIHSAGSSYLGLSHVGVAAGIAKDEVLEGHVLAILEIDKGRNCGILGNMFHPDLGGNVVQQGRATSVDHPGAEDGHILDSLSP